MVDAEQAVDEGSDGVAEYGVSEYAKMSVIGSALAALGYAIADLILGFGDAVFAPVRAFGQGIAAFISGTLMAPIRITDAGADASAQSFLTGAAAALGPLAFPVAVGVSVLGILIFLWFINRISISPTQLLNRNDG